MDKGVLNIAETLYTCINKNHSAQNLAFYYLKNHQMLKLLRRENETTNVNLIHGN